MMLSTWVPATHAMSDCKEQGTRGMVATFQFESRLVCYSVCPLDVLRTTGQFGPVASPLLEFLILVSLIFGLQHILRTP